MLEANNNVVVYDHSPVLSHTGISKIIALSISNASIRAVDNLKDMFYTLMLVQRTSAQCDFVTPYTRANIVALFVRAAGGLLEPLDALINEAVGEINRLSMDAVEQDVAEAIGRQQHVIRELLTNAYVVAIIDCLLAQGIYSLVPLGLRQINQVGALLGNTMPAQALAERTLQINAYGQWVLIGVCFELLSFPSLSLLLAHQRKRTTFLIGLSSVFIEVLCMYEAIHSAGEDMSENLSTYGKIFLLGSTLKFVLLTGKVWCDPRLTRYLRPQWGHLDRRVLKKLLALGTPILCQMLAAATTLYAFALCVIDLIGPTALKTHYAPRRILYPLNDFMPALAKVSSIFMAQYPAQRLKFAKNCLFITNGVLATVALLFVLANCYLADKMIGAGDYDKTIIAPVFLWSLVSAGCYMNSLAFSHFLMSMQQTLSPALIKTTCMMFIMPGLAFCLSRSGGLVGAEIGIAFALILMLLGMVGLFYWQINRTQPLLNGDQPRSDQPENYYRQWQASRGSQQFFVPSRSVILPTVSDGQLPTAEFMLNEQGVSSAEATHTTSWCGSIKALFKR